MEPFAISTRNGIDPFGDSNVTLRDIAKELGYAANSHFTRVFRRWTGVAPRELRNG